MKSPFSQIASTILLLLLGFQLANAQTVPSATNIQINLAENGLPVSGNKTVVVNYGAYSTGNQTVTFAKGLGTVSVDIPIETLKSDPTTQLQILVEGVVVSNIAPETVPFSKVTIFAYEADNANKVVGKPFDVNMVPQTGDVLQWDGNQWIAASPSAQASAVKIVTPANFATIEISSYDILKFEGTFNLLEVFTSSSIHSKLSNAERVTIYGGVFNGTEGNTSPLNTIKTGCSFIFSNSIFKNVDFDGCGDSQFNNCMFTGNTVLTPSSLLLNCEVTDGTMNASDSNVSGCIIARTELNNARSIANSRMYQSIVAGSIISNNRIEYSSIRVNSPFTNQLDPMISNNYFDRCHITEGAFISISTDADVMVTGNHFNASFADQYVVKNTGINTEIHFLNNRCWDTDNVFNTVAVGSYSKISIIGNVFKQIRNMGLEDNGSNIRFISNIVY